MCGLKKVDYGFALLSMVVLGVLLVAVATGSVDLWVLLTRMGDEEFYLVFAVLAYYLAPSPVLGLSIVLAVVISGSLNIFLKYLFNTPRPLNPLIKVEGPGFPSGHAQVSTSFWSAVSIAWKKIVLVAFSIVVVVAVSMSRVYLRAHYVLDVVGGVLIGLVTGVLPVLIVGRGGFSSTIGGLVLSIIAVFLGFVNVVYLGFEQSSASVLLGVGIAVLLIFSIGYRHVYSLARIRFVYRFSGFVVSSALMLLVHFLTTDLNVFARALLFTACGLLVLLGIPMLVSKAAS